MGGSQYGKAPGDAESLAGADAVDAVVLHEGQPLTVQEESQDPLGLLAGCELPDPSCLTLLSYLLQAFWAPPSEQKSMTQWSSHLKTWPPARTASMLSGCPTGRRQKVSWATSGAASPCVAPPVLPPACQVCVPPSPCYSCPSARTDGHRDGLAWGSNMTVPSSEMS